MDITIRLKSSNHDTLPVLCLNSQGEAVKKLQQFLTLLGHYRGDINGYFCLNTERSVRAFQFQIGIPSDGIVNQKTWTAITRLTRFLGF